MDGLQPTALINMADSKQRLLLAERTDRNATQAASAADRYPAPIGRQSFLPPDQKARPTLLLGVIRQESVFRPLASLHRSPRFVAANNDAPRSMRQTPDERSARESALPT